MPLLKRIGNILGDVVFYGSLVILSIAAVVWIAYVGMIATQIVSAYFYAPNFPYPP